MLAGSRRLICINMKLKDIAILIDGRLIGDGNIEISGVSGLSETRSGHITYLSGGKYLKQARDSVASAVIVKAVVEDLDKPQILVANPELTFAQLLGHFYQVPKIYEGVSPNATVSSEAVIGENVTIHAYAYVNKGVVIGKDSIIYPGVFIGENCVVGEGCLIYPNVTIREGVTVGSRVIIHAGAVIGADGFGYVFDGRAHRKIPQVGSVLLEDDVEIGANTTIDRATTGLTVIGRGTKIDNLVQIGHNVRIGRNVILVSQVGIAGSCDIGDGVAMGGQAGIPDHVSIEAGAMIGAQAGVVGDVKKGIYLGSPAIPHRDFFKSSVVFSQLPELKKKILELEEKIKLLEAPKDRDCNLNE
jgi:UDP-3-O-[3-hydroxymyristoyl] glucosamine N-acyltransferase